ncbi:MAG: hypothetical protein CSA22_09955 [Deltaproteobacteria bacterium]|nr:MAG: hypothetical protein CSA22_09955 [Deltaproteobacteria bacterium]
MVIVKINAARLQIDRVQPAPFQHYRQCGKKVGNSVPSHGSHVNAFVDFSFCPDCRRRLYPELEQITCIPHNIHKIF